MNTLKAKTTISCACCGCDLKRTKSIKVQAGTKEDAVKEGRQKFQKWVESLKGQQCKICKSISEGI
jgi:hypothetical protein